MNRGFRLRNSSDIKRLWREGKSYMHPLMVLVIHHAPGSLDPVCSTRLSVHQSEILSEESSTRHKIRAAVIAGSKVGSAVQRNRAKRRLRAALGTFLPHLRGNIDMLLLARRSVLQATRTQIDTALNTLLSQAGLLNAPPGTRITNDGTHRNRNE